MKFRILKVDYPDSEVVEAIGVVYHFLGRHRESVWTLDDLISNLDELVDLGYLATDMADCIWKAIAKYAQDA